ncbi:MAG: hypothetical protein ACNS62_07980 [Candidatus Cyclobacteriaceae bacterium M3_2C_046]
MIHLLIVLITWMIPAQEDVKWVKTKVVEGITVELPDTFVPMTEQEINQKYISYRKPVALYTSPNRMVDFGVNLSVTQWDEGDLDILRNFYRSSILNLYDEVDWINQEIKEINKVKFVLFEFTSTVNPDENSIVNNQAIRKYSYLQYAIVNGKTLVFNFTAPLQRKEHWQDVAQHLMNSIKIKKTL